MTAVERMKSLIQSLPTKDRKTALKLLNSRQFEDLYELVKADIYIHRKSNTPVDSDLNNMIILSSEVLSYVDQIGWTNEDILSDYEEY